MVCSYQFVSEVVIGAPYSVTEDLMKQLKVDLVCHGHTEISSDYDGKDTYEVPKRDGKFKLLDSQNPMTTQRIVERIIEHRMDYEIRNVKKEKKEIAAFNALMKHNKEKQTASD